MTAQSQPAAAAPGTARHVHILGIGGTFMAGIAQLARALGWRVSGRDGPLWPPMSDQLRAAGIAWSEDLRAADPPPLPDDAEIVVGNVCTRGMPVVEALLDSGRDYVSGPEWLARHVLRGRWVLAVAGTHGKTTTASLLAQILDHAGLAPGFLIGGVPKHFGVSARLGASPFFVVEADEYDSAFFDKRAKFVHYRPRTLVLNNLEFDHADIYPDLAAIQRQFHHLVRTVPRSGLIVAPARDAALREVLAMGCWTPVVAVAADVETEPDDRGHAALTVALARSASAETSGRVRVTVRAPDDGPSGDGDPTNAAATARATVHEGDWPVAGRHNRANLAAALAAARHAGVPIDVALAGAARFGGVARRLDVRGEPGGVLVVDDFAHHPTAIAETLRAARERWPGRRLVAVVEPRSNTMRLGVHADALGDAFDAADHIWLLHEPSLAWDTSALARRLGPRLAVRATVAQLAADVIEAAEPGDVVVVMSNGAFGGLHERLLDGLRDRSTD